MHLHIGDVTYATTVQADLHMYVQTFRHLRRATHDIKFHAKSLRHESKTRGLLRRMISLRAQGATTHFNHQIVGNHGTCSLKASRHVSDVQMFNVSSRMCTINLALYC